MTDLLTPEKIDIDLYKPAPRPAIVPGSFSDSKISSQEPNYAKDIIEKYKLPEYPPEPAKVKVDQD